MCYHCIFLTSFQLESLRSRVWRLTDIQTLITRHSTGCNFTPTFKTLRRSRPVLLTRLSCDSMQTSFDWKCLQINAAGERNPAVHWLAEVHAVIWYKYHHLKNSASRTCLNFDPAQTSVPLITSPLRWIRLLAG